MATSVEIPRAPVRPSRPDSAAPPDLLREELRLISERMLDASECRHALLEAVLRHRQLLGAVWVELGEGQPILAANRCTGPLADRDGVMPWILRTAQHCHVVRCCRSEHGEIRNLSALGLGIALPEGRREAIVLLTVRMDAAEAAVLEQALHLAAGAWERRELLRLTRAAEEQARCAAALVDLTRRLDCAEDLTGAGQALVQSVQDHLQCGLVALGLTRRASRLPRLATISDGHGFDRNSMQCQRLEAVLAESVLCGQALSWPPVGNRDSTAVVAHRRLGETLGCEGVLSVPLRDADETIVGSLICTGEARRLLVEPTRRFLDAAAVPVGAALASARRSEGGRCIRSMRTASKWLKSWRGWLALAGTCGVAGVLSIPMTYRIPARGELAVVERRVSVAPFEGLLLETLAAPGDVVEAGQPLARMDGREVHWELAGVLAERERAARERDTALAAHDVSRSLMAGLEVERLQTREELLRNRLDRLEVRSPLTGIVLSGSLERRENVPVDVGQALYEIAPLEALRLEVAVPAAEISHVRPGMVVEVRLAGTASEIVTGRISRIRPASELRGGRNVFIAHVELPNPDGRWRPGMEGSVRIVGDSHPLGWNLFHRAWEYLLTRVP